MDWRRAKTILIIAFLTLDLYLGSLLYTNYRENNSWVAKNTISDSQIQDLAQSKSINLDQLKEEPHVPEEMSVYSGTTTQLELESWNPVGDGVYEKILPTPLLVKANPKEIKALLQQEQLPNLDEFQFSRMEISKNAIVIYQTKNGFRIFNGTIRLKLNSKKEVISYRFSHYKLEELPQPHRPNKFNNALASLLLQSKTKATIQSAELGYQRNNYLREDKDSIIIPIWRFQVGSNYYYVSTTSSDSINSIQPATPIREW